MSCMPNETLSFLQLDRVLGTVFGGAVGDALGAGYEFAQPPEAPAIAMRRGRLTGEPAGHWTDDTAMAIGVLRSAATYRTLDTVEAQTVVASEFLAWYHSHPSDIGRHTARVLSRTTTANEMASVALAVQGEDPEAAGNGSLMRTGPVALTGLGDDEHIARTARAISTLTHAHPDAQDACVLWSIAVDRAIRLGSLEGPRAGLPQLSPDQRLKWEAWIEEAEQNDPVTFNPNRYVVRAFQAAWSAIVATQGEVDHFGAGLRRAITIGDDTDTVAAIAGALLGARYGVTAIPFAWRHRLAGWPRDVGVIDLVSLAVRAARGDDGDGWPSVRTMRPAYERFSPRGATYRFAVDEGVIFGDFGALATTSTDAYLSLCRIGVDDRKAGEHEVVWLLDQPGNANAARVLADTADAIAAFRAVNKTVFVHCVRAESRTPTVAMAWLIRHYGYEVESAITEVLATMPSAAPEESLLAAVRHVTSR